MATDSTTSSTSAGRKATSTPIVVHTDAACPSSFNIGILLDDTNYDLWAPLVEMHIGERKKIGFLRGSEKAPPDEDPKFDDWFYEDQRVKSWLLSGMKPELMRRYIRLPTTSDIWAALKSSFADEKNEVKVYALTQRASRLRQGTHSVSQYFGELTEIWQELDHCHAVTMSCEVDVKLFKESQERQRVYLFLDGLEDNFEQVRGEIFRKNPPFGLQAAYAYARREEDRQAAMKSDGVDSGHAEALAARNQSDAINRSSAGRSEFGRSPSLRPNPNRGRKNNVHGQRVTCGHCGVLGHSKERCFELIGYPSGWDKSRDPRHNKQRASVAETVAEPVPSTSSATALTTRTNSKSNLAGYPDTADDWLWH